MTEQSSCKSLFKTYLFYKIKQNSAFFVLCCLMNILALPLFAVAMNKGLTSTLTGFYQLGFFFSIFAIIVLPFLAINGAVISFAFYTKKNLSDTIGSLPISYKQRFWADFIGGYIVNVAPIIPSGIISLCIFGASEGKYNDFCKLNEIANPINFTGYGAALFFNLFIITTFAYIIAAVIVSSCGKVVSTTLFSIIAVFGLPMFVGGIVGVFATCATGMDVKSVVGTVTAFLPPVGLFGEVYEIIKFFNVYLEQSEVITKSCDFISLKPSYIIVYIILAAALIAAAYFIGKNRKIEKTGSKFVFKSMYYAISLVSTIGVSLSILGFAYNRADNYILYGLICGAIICVVNILIYLPNKKEILRCIASGAGGILFSVLLLLLFDKTGSFGNRYISEDGSKYEYLLINEKIKLTDKDDISQYVKLLNHEISTHTDQFGYNNEYGDIIEYKTSSGKVKQRKYYISNYYSHGIDFESIIKKLGGYSKYFFEELDSYDFDWSISVKTEKISADISPEDAEEFLKVLKREAAEKYKDGAEIAGTVEFSEIVGDRVNYMGYHRSFNIQKDFTDTLDMISLLGADQEIDPESQYFYIDYNGFNNAIHIEVPYKDREDPIVKEMMSCFVTEADFDNSDYFDFHIVSEDIHSDRYYVPPENKQRVIELMTQYAEKKLTSPDAHKSITGEDEEFATKDDF